MTLATMPVATINGKLPVAMGSMEYGMPLYEALDEITSLKRSSRPQIERLRDLEATELKKLRSLRYQAASIA